VLVDASVTVEVGDNGWGVVVDAVAVEIGDDGDGERRVYIGTGDGGTVDPRVPEFEVAVVAVGDTGDVEQVGEVVPAPENPVMVLLVVEVMTTSPGRRSSGPAENVPGKGGTLLCILGP
jgi:hypothetical protein